MQSLKVQKIFEKVDACDDEDYKKLVSEPLLQESREYITKLWSIFSPYADAKFIPAFRKNCYERLWELWLGSYLLESGFSLESGGKTEWPDFHGKKGRHEFLIEAVCINNAEPTTGNEINPLSTIQHNSDGTYIAEFEEISFEKHELRYYRAIKEKYYSKSLEIGRRELPYIIAISGGKLPYSHMNFGDSFPAIIKALYPIGNECISMKYPDNLLIARIKKNFNTKKSGGEVTKEIFSNNNFSLISGVIFSPYPFVRKKENIKDGLYLVKNPYAKYPLRVNLDIPEYIVTYTGDSISIELK